MTTTTPAIQRVYGRRGGPGGGGRELRRLDQDVSSDPYAAFGRLDGYEAAESDHADLKRHQIQLMGQFLIDRNGIIRYTYVERARDPEGFGEMASAEEVLVVARAL